MIETVINYYPEYLIDKNGNRLQFKFDPTRNETFKDEDGNILDSCMSGLGEAIKIMGGLHKEELSLTTLTILNSIEKTIYKFRNMAIDAIKLQEKLMEMFITELKAIYAENKVAQAAFNRLKEKVSLEKEEISKNKELVKIAKEVFEKV